MSTITIRHKEFKFIQRPEWWAKVAGGQWEPHVFDVLNMLIKPDGISMNLNEWEADHNTKFTELKRTKFIDLGAWNGIFSIYAAKLGAISYAVEPDLVAFKELVENVFLNKADVICCCQGIYNFDGIQKIWAWSDAEFGNSETSVLHLDKCNSSRNIKVSKLKTFCNFHKLQLSSEDAIKIDIEGAEYEMIKESIAFLKLFKPKILLSVHPAYLPAGAIDELLDLLCPVYSFRTFSEMNKPIDRSTILFLIQNGEHSFVLI